jgi:hypothetical protein
MTQSAHRLTAIAQACLQAVSSSDDIDTELSCVGKRYKVKLLGAGAVRMEVECVG